MNVIRPDWPAPARVRSLVTTREGGASLPPYDGFNLATHVGDEPDAVRRNRAALRALLPEEPAWLDQRHTTAVAEADRNDPGCVADAGVARRPGAVCAVLTADCLPVLFCDDGGTCVAAAHAGWRGLAAGILEACVARMAVAPGRLMAWFGPAIGPARFEVGDDVLEAFTGRDASAAAEFARQPNGRWLADLYGLAHRRLAAVGVERVYGGGLCTATDAARFYSYRRDGRTGRMASLVWLDRD